MHDASAEIARRSTAGQGFVGAATKAVRQAFNRRTVVSWRSA
jgi:hypothetical protein